MPGYQNPKRPIKKNPKINEVLSRAIDFVLLREKREGGFGATPKLPATIEDTFHSLKIIEFLMGERENTLLDSRGIKRHREYLFRFFKRDLDLNLRSIYQILWSYNYLGGDVKKFPVDSYLSEKGHGNSITGIYYKIKIFDLLERSFLFQKNAVTFGFSGILKRRWMSLFLSERLGLKMVERDKAIYWLRACQNYDGGFGFMPGTTSFIENTFYGLRALNLLGGKPKDTEMVLNYVLSCRTKSGGFSRKANAAPFLDATYYAIGSLMEIQEKGDGFV